MNERIIKYESGQYRYIKEKVKLDDKNYNPPNIKPVYKSHYRCKSCKEYGHNKRTCPYKTLKTDNIIYIKKPTTI